MSNLESWIEHENAQWKALVTHDDGTPAIWADLVRRSAPHVQNPNLRNVPYMPRWDANSAFTPSSIPEYYGLAADLAAEWLAYRDLWEAFLNRNPRCRIADMMSEMSEANDASSWPYGWEDEIEAWVREGFPEPSLVPWASTIQTPGWRQRLADATARVGDGWVYNEDGIYKWR